VLEALLAVVLFTMAFLPLMRLYSGQGLGQQRAVRDFMAVTNVAEKVLNRIDHQMEKKLYNPLVGPGRETLQDMILLKAGSETSPLGFIAPSFHDESGKRALKYIPTYSCTVQFKPLAVTTNAVPADQRNNNPKLLADTLAEINRRAGVILLESAWEDTGRLKHNVNLVHIRAFKPEF